AWDASPANQLPYSLRRTPVDPSLLDLKPPPREWGATMAAAGAELWRCSSCSLSSPYFFHLFAGALRSGLFHLVVRLSPVDHYRSKKEKGDLPPLDSQTRIAVNRVCWPWRCSPHVSWLLFSLPPLPGQRPIHFSDPQTVSAPAGHCDRLQRTPLPLHGHGADSQPSLLCTGRAVSRVFSVAHSLRGSLAVSRSPFPSRHFRGSLFIGPFCFSSPTPRAARRIAKRH